MCVSQGGERGEYCVNSYTEEQKHSSIFMFARISLALHAISKCFCVSERESERESFKGGRFLTPD